MSFGLRILKAITVSLLVPILAVLLASQASSRWGDFTFNLKQLKSATSNSTTRTMAAKTPVFLCVVAPSLSLYSLRFIPY